MATKQFKPVSPGSHRRPRWPQAVALVIFIAALTLYVRTLAPSVVALFDDSLEFQLVAYQLAIAHPTGYPLYTLLGWLFTRLPLGDVAYRVNLMSAFFGALTITLVYLVGLALTPDAESSPPWIGVAGASIGALALAVSPVFWSQATVAEVYTLNAAFVAGILWLLVRRERRGTDRPLLAAEARLTSLAFLFGLSLTHHRTMLLLLPAIGLYLWRQRAEAQPVTPRLRGWAWAKPALAFAAPLLLYLYLPLRGHVGSLDESYTNTLTGFWRHVTAGGYGVFIFDNPFGTERGAGFYLSLFLNQFGPLGLIAGLLGLGVLRRGHARSLTGVAFATYGAFNLFYRVADIEVFFIPLFLIWAIWVGVGVGWLLTRLASTGIGRRPWLRRSLLPLLPLIVLLFAGQPFVLIWPDLPALDRSDDWEVHDYGLDIMRQPLEPRATIVGILGETTLVRYFQATEGLRPDLLLVAADQESERLATVAHLLDRRRAVYLTRPLPGAPDRWSLSAVGPLIRVHREPILEAPDTSFLMGTSLTPEITLHGYVVNRPPTHHRPPPLRLTLAWQVTAPLTRELKVSARLYPTGASPAETSPIAQTDAAPVHFAYPTTAWRPGEFITDVYDLTLPANLPPGDYTPWLILYDPARGATEVARLALTPIRLP